MRPAHRSYYQTKSKFVFTRSRLQIYMMDTDESLLFTSNECPTDCGFKLGDPCGATRAGSSGRAVAGVARVVRTQWPRRQLQAGLVSCLQAGLVGCLQTGLVGCLQTSLVRLQAGLMCCLQASLVRGLQTGLVRGLHLNTRLVRRLHLADARLRHGVHLQILHRRTVVQHLHFWRHVIQAWSLWTNDVQILRHFLYLHYIAMY